VANDTVNTTKIWKPESFQALELQRAREVTVDYPRHWHDEFYLSATLAGESLVECGGATFSTPAGQLVVIAPGEVHANRKVRVTARTLFLDFGAFRDIAERYIETHLPTFDFRSGLIRDETTTSSFLRMHRALESPQSQLAEETIVAEFLVDLSRQSSVIPTGLRDDVAADGVVERVKRYLEEHYAERVLLETLANLTRVSPYYLNRSFRRKVGMPPHAYQLQLRIAHGKRLLRLGYPICETACAVGFFDQSHFVHAFQRSEGATPTQFVRLSKNLQAGKSHTHYFDHAL
jgi:AraC-like DNA-binding protein